MGEYAIFVWPSYAAVVVVLTVICFTSWKNKKADEKKLAALKSQLDNLSEQE